jgi:hypothetical protein
MWAGNIISTGRLRYVQCLSGELQQKRQLGEFNVDERTILQYNLE